MVLSHCFKVRSLILTAAVIIGLGHVTHASAQERAFLIDLNSKTITPLGILGGGYTRVADINNAGQVVGSSYTTLGPTHAFITGLMA